MFFYIDVLLKDKQLNNKTTNSVWKPIPSEARVTRDKVSGGYRLKRKLSGRQYLIYAWIRYCLPDSCIYVFLYPETLSRVTLASLGIGFQPKLPTTDNQQPIIIYLLIFYSNLPTTNNHQPTTYHYSPFILSCRASRRLSEEVRESLRRMFVR